jgi:hypothetical protein
MTRQAPRLPERAGRLCRPRLRTPGLNSEARVIVCYMPRHCFHGGFEIFVCRIDEKPLSENLVRHQRLELGLNGSVTFVVRTDQDPMPVPATGFRWLDEQQHLTLEEVRGKPTEHSLGEEGPVLDKRLENPLVFERLHVSQQLTQNRERLPRVLSLVLAVLCAANTSGAQSPAPTELAWVGLFTPTMFAWIGNLNTLEYRCGPGAPGSAAFEKCRAEKLAIKFPSNVRVAPFVSTGWGSDNTNAFMCSGLTHRSIPLAVPGLDQSSSRGVREDSWPEPRRRAAAPKRPRTSMGQGR